VAEAGVAGAQDGLGAVGYLQLGEDGREVIGNRLDAEAGPKMASPAATAMMARVISCCSAPLRT
jgi:hypothetical protein